MIHREHPQPDLRSVMVVMISRILISRIRDHGFQPSPRHLSTLTNHCLVRSTSQDRHALLAAGLHVGGLRSCFLSRAGTARKAWRKPRPLARAPMRQSQRLSPTGFWLLHYARDMPMGAVAQARGPDGLWQHHKSKCSAPFPRSYKITLLVTKIISAR